MPSRHPRAELDRLKRISIEERGGTVRVEDFVTPEEPGPEFDRLMGIVPDILAGRDFRRAVSAVADAARDERGVLVMFGAHVIKCGLSRLLIDLMERRIVTAVATNGAGAIHDFEIAKWGRTSEDVAARIVDGSFGMCEETADLMNEAAAAGHREDLGLGESIGRAVSDAPHADASVLAAAHRLGVPATLHVGIGTDIIHQHASADGAALGATSHTDFRILAEVVRGLDGGCVVNVGSAVVLPEVFLKALSVARNLGAGGRGLTTISMDMNAPYRVAANVIGRPTSESGMGIALRGRHELLFPLFWAGVVRRCGPGPGAEKAG